MHCKSSENHFAILAWVVCTSCMLLFIACVMCVDLPMCGCGLLMKSELLEIQSLQKNECNKSVFKIA